MISWALYDWANSAFPTLILTFVFAAYFTRQVATNETVGTVLWGYALSAAGLVVAIGGFILGAIIDQTGRRKPWIAAASALCIAATALLWFVKPSQDFVWRALFLVGLGVIGIEYAGIFYNAMLASIAPSDRIGRWSGWGWALGYAGGLTCLTIALFGFVRAENPWFALDRSSAEHVRATFVFVAAWFLIFSLPLFLFTPDVERTGKSWSQAVRDGLQQLRDSIRQARRYRGIVRFLIARMIYIDGLATMFIFGGVFAAGTFDMKEEEILSFGMALNVTGGLGAAAFAWLDDRLGGKATILISLLGLTIAAGLMLVVRTSALFWLCGLVLGIFVGPAQAAGRSYLARVAPEALRNQIFGLEAFSGKATAFAGPLLVGWITGISNSQRLGMAAIVVFFAVGFLLMLKVPSDKS